MANVPDTRNPSNPQLELGLAKVDIDWLSQSAPKKSLGLPAAQLPKRRRTDSCWNAMGSLYLYSVWTIILYICIYCICIYMHIHTYVNIYICLLYIYIYTYTFSDCRHTTLYMYTMFHACMYVTVHDCITLSTYVPLCCLVSLICQLIFT